jgi:hypothetical protein
MDLKSVSDPGKAPGIELYQYSRLREGCIRLLKLNSLSLVAFASTSNSPPAALKSSQRSYEIIRVALQCAPRFEVVSYVWGNSTRSRSLVLSNNQWLPITESVSEALDFLVRA